MYSISALWRFTLALSDDFLFVVYTTEFPIGVPDYPGIRTSPPPHIFRMTEGLLYHKTYNNSQRCNLANNTGGGGRGKIDHGYYKY
jgi:hypothetical protein